MVSPVLVGVTQVTVRLLLVELVTITFVGIGRPKLHKIQASLKFFFANFVLYFIVIDDYYCLLCKHLIIPLNIIVVALVPNLQLNVPVNML